MTVVYVAVVNGIVLLAGLIVKGWVDRKFHTEISNQVEDVHREVRTGNGGTAGQGIDQLNQTLKQHIEQSERIHKGLYEVLANQQKQQKGQRKNGS